MPLRNRRSAERTPETSDLQLRLVEEWRDPSEEAEEPVIIEETHAENLPTHLYVIWRAWGDLSQRDRSEIIMDAYEEVRGPDGALLVSVAMGLTPAEAERMGIRYE